MFKSLIVKIFLQKEVNALKVRLSEASNALKKIEASVVALPRGASADTHALAEAVLKHVLSSADAVRVKEEGFVHDWERKAYSVYNAGKATLESTLSYAESLIGKTKVFF